MFCEDSSDGWGGGGCGRVWAWLGVGGDRCGGGGGSGGWGWGALQCGNPCPRVLPCTEGALRGEPSRRRLAAGPQSPAITSFPGWAPLGITTQRPPAAFTQHSRPSQHKPRQALGTATGPYQSNLMSAAPAAPLRLIEPSLCLTQQVGSNGLQAQLRQPPPGRQQRQCWCAWATARSFTCVRVEGSMSVGGRFGFVCVYVQVGGGWVYMGRLMQTFGPRGRGIQWWSNSLPPAPPLPPGSRCWAPFPTATPPVASSRPSLAAHRCRVRLQHSSSSSRQQPSPGRSWPARGWKWSKVPRTRSWPCT